ncbi:hypothetical protein JCM11491_003350 [Sporobolomyces phaffii]
MTPPFDWTALFGSPTRTREYTESLGQSRSLAAWLYLVELVAHLRQLGQPGDARPVWTDSRHYLDHLYLRPRAAPDGQHPPPFRLPLALLESLAPILPLVSDTLDAPTRSTLVSSIRAGLDYLSDNSPPSTSTSTVPLADQVDMLLSKERLPNFPRPPSRSLRDSILVTADQLDTQEAAQSIVSILLNHYTGPAASSTPPTPPSPRSALRPPVGATEDDDSDNDGNSSDTRSIRTGIQEARESIVRKEDKLRWLLGDNFQKGPSCRSSSTISSPTTSSVGSTASYSNSTIRRPVSTTPTPSRIYHDEMTSTVGELPEFPSRSLSEQRDSVDSVASSNVESQRQLRLISTSSSTAPLLASGSSRPSTGSMNRDAPSPLPLSSAPHRRVLSTGVLPASSTSYSFNNVEPLASPRVPTPPLQPLDDDSPSSRPFAYLYDLPSPKNNKRNSLDSAKDDLKYGRRESIPLDCQELSEKEKSELVRRNKKLEKLLGGHFGGQRTTKSSPRRRGHSDDTDSAARERAGGGFGDTRERFDGRRLARPVSIAIPALRLGAAQSPSSVSPTTVVPTDTDDLSPRSNSVPRNAHTDEASGARTEPRPALMHRSSSTPSYSPASSSPTSPNCYSTFPSLSPDLYLARTISSTTTTLSTLRAGGSPSRPRISHHSSSNSTSSSQHSQSVEQERKRDERRKKLEKVRRVLGERVPVNLVVQTKPLLYDDERHELGGGGRGAGDDAKGGTSMGKSKSRMMGLFKNEHGGTHWVGTEGGGSKGKKRSQDPENWVGTRSAPQLGGQDTRRVGKPAGNAGGGGVQGVEALTKARKLESLFGDLPPQSLYLAPALVQPLTSGRAPPLKHRRSRSDIGTSQSPSLSAGSSTFGSARGSLDLDLDLCRSRSNSSSIQSYRQSIASLRYVMEQDPGGLDEVVRAYTDGGPHAEGEDSSAVSDVDAPFPGPTSTTLPRTLPASSTSHAAVRKAQKLSSFFGTTKGEVWQRLLDDIATAVEEDEELELEERREVLESLDKLREGVQQQQQQQHH